MVAKISLSHLGHPLTCPLQTQAQTTRTALQAKKNHQNPQETSHKAGRDPVFRPGAKEKSLALGGLEGALTHSRGFPGDRERKQNHAIGSRQRKIGKIAQEVTSLGSPKDTHEGEEHKRGSWERLTVDSYVQVHRDVIVQGLPGSSESACPSSGERGGRGPSSISRPLEPGFRIRI